MCEHKQIYKNDFKVYVKYLFYGQTGCVNLIIIVIIMRFLV